MLKKQRRLTPKEGHKSKAALHFKKIDPKKLKERGERRRSGSFDSIFKDGVDTYRPKQGENNFRILQPTWENPEHFGYVVWVHAWVGPGNGSYLCPLKMKQKRCPICAEAMKARKAGEEEEARALEPREQVIYYVLDRDAKDDIPKVYAAGWSIDRDICARLQDRRTGETLYIYHPEVGYDIYVKRVGSTKIDTRYIGLDIDRQPSPMCEDEKRMDEIIEQIEATPIPDLLVYKDEKYLQGVLEGAVAEKDEDLDDTESDDDDNENGAEGDKEKEVEDEETTEDNEEEKDDEEGDEEEADDKEDADEDEDDEDQEDEDDEETIAAKRRNGPDQRSVKPKKEERLPHRREREERATRSRK